MRDFLDVHAARGGRHDAKRRVLAIQSDGEVALGLDVRAFLDEKRLTCCPSGFGLVRHQLHAEDLLRVGAYIVLGLRDLHAAAFASAARVDLGFHDPGTGRKPHRSHLHRLFDGKGRPALAGSVLPNPKLFALVFVNFHLLAICIRRLSLRERR